MKSIKKALFDHWKTIGLILVNSIFFLLFSLITYQFKIMAVIAFVVVLINYFLSKNILFSLFTTFFVSSFFNFPSKSYSVELLGWGETKHSLFRDGMLIEYGITISDLLGISLLVYFCRAGLNFIFSKNSWSNIKKILTSRKNTSEVILPFVSWFAYSTWSVLTTFKISYLPSFSLLISLQSYKILLFFTGAYYFLTKGGSLIKNFFYVVTTILLIQCLLGFYQITTFQNAAEFAQEEVVIEESTPLPRAFGVMGNANPHALVTTLLLAVVAPFLIVNHKRLFILLASFTALNVLLSQSRTLWLSWGIIGIIIIWKFRKIITTLIKKKLKEILLLSSLGLLLINLVLLPRIVASKYFWEEDGGGTLRLKMIEEGFFTLLHSPIWGYGTGMTVPAIFSFYPDGYITYFPFPVHFTPLQIAIESGLLGLLTFFVPILFSLSILIPLAKQNWKSDIIWILQLLGVVSLLCYYGLQPSNINLKEVYYFAIILAHIIFKYNNNHDFKT